MLQKENILQELYIFFFFLHNTVIIIIVLKILWSGLPSAAHTKVPYNSSKF